MRLVDLEDYSQIATKQDLALAIAELRAEIHKDFGDFKADLMKTLWLTQLSTIAIILVGVGIIVHWR
jgi:hypothetical protein